MIMTDDNCTVEQAMILASVNHHSFFGSSQGVVKYIRPRIPCESGMFESHKLATLALSC